MWNRKKHLGITGICFVLGAACRSGEPTAPATPVVASVFNFLRTPVALSVGGVQYGSLGVASQTALTLAAGTSAVAWTPSPFRYSDGSPIPSDLSSASSPIVAGTVDVSNVIAGQPYFMAHIFDDGGADADIGVFNGATVTCLGWLSPSFVGFDYGYYRLGPSTEVRVYHGHTNCAGTYRFWSTAQLTGYETKTGRLVLTIDSIP